MTTDEPGPLAALGALLLIAALAVGVFLTYGHQAIEYRQQAQQGMDLLAQGRYTEAQALYEGILPHYSGPDARLGLSYAYLARRDGDRAETQARLVLQDARPDWKPAAWSQLGRVLLFKGDTSGALHAWRSAVAAAGQYSGEAPVDAEARSSTWHAAMTEWEQSNFDGAQADLEKLEGGSDVYAMSASVKLAQLSAPTNKALSQERSREARQLLNAGGGAIPDLRVPGVEEGISKEEAASTLDALDKAFADVGSSPGMAADAIWGRSYLQQGEPYLAVRELQRAVDLQPNVSDLHAYLGLALLEVGRESDAIGQLQQAARLDPTRALPHQALARLYVARKDWSAAMSELSAVKHIEPDSVTTHLQLADYYVQRGAYDVAEEEYAAAVNQARAGANTPAGLDPQLALARFYEDVRGQGCENGLPLAQESLASHPGAPASLDAVGWGLVLCGKAGSALSSLENAVQAAPDVPEYRYHLGRAYALLGRATDAREQYTRTIDFDPGGPWEQLARSELPGLPASP